MAKEFGRFDIDDFIDEIPRHLIQRWFAYFVVNGCDTYGTRQLEIKARKQAEDEKFLPPDQAQKMLASKY